MMEFKYDTVRASDQPHSWTSIVEQAEDLLYNLRFRREEPEQLRRPILFVCHSFGGLLLKNVSIDTPTAYDNNIDRRCSSPNAVLIFVIYLTAYPASCFWLASTMKASQISSRTSSGVQLWSLVLQKQRSMTSWRS